MLGIGLGVNAVQQPRVMASGDFTNIGSANAADGVYTLNGNPATVGDIFNLSHPDTNFDPEADIDAGGLKPHEAGETAAYLNSALVSQIVGGYTAVFAVLFVDDGSVLNAQAFDNPDYNVHPGCKAQWFLDGPVDTVETWSGDNNSHDVFNDKIGGAGEHKIAVTVAGELISISVDGGAVFSSAFSGVNPITDGFFFNIGGDVATRLRSFAFYEPVDDADLPTLSELS